MSPTLPIGLLAFDGVQALDITGPAAVFAAANDALGRVCYRLHILSPAGGEVVSNCGVKLATEALATIDPGALHTLLVAGGDRHGLAALGEQGDVRQWVIRACAEAKRYGSICTGAFVLARCGLTDGKRVTTHWEACAELAKRYPEVDVDPNALYVEDGRVWTSAGVTTGIDMALALVERDVSRTVASAIARRLVLYARRPGYQAQFSPVLLAQTKADNPFGELIGWIKAHLPAKLDVPILAARMAMSDRSFHRKFTHQVGETPARFVETLRLGLARDLLAAGIPMKEIAAKTGYATPALLSKAFHRRFGMTPTLFRQMHGDAA